MRRLEACHVGWREVKMGRNMLWWVHGMLQAFVCGSSVGLWPPPTQPRNDDMDEYTVLHICDDTKMGGQSLNLLKQCIESYL